MSAFRPFWKCSEKYGVMTYSDFDTRRLITEVSVCNPETGLMVRCRGLWDTGGKISTVSLRLINQLALMPDPTMSMRVHTSSGVHLSRIFPIKLIFDDFEINCSALSCDSIVDGVDIIIGMDVITKGDLSITNVNGKTEMIFRLPTLGHVSK